MTAPIREEIYGMISEFTGFDSVKEQLATALESLVKRECLRERIKNLTMWRDWLKTAKENPICKDTSNIMTVTITELQSELEKEG